jgi:hypothetical protein
MPIIDFPSASSTVPWKKVCWNAVLCRLSSHTGCPGHSSSHSVRTISISSLSLCPDDTFLGLKNQAIILGSIQSWCLPIFGHIIPLNNRFRGEILCSKEKLRSFSLLPPLFHSQYWGEIYLGTCWRGNGRLL